MNKLDNRWAKKKHIYHCVLEMQTYIHISKFQIKKNLIWDAPHNSLIQIIMISNPKAVVPMNLC
jgi:hypothetical protein